MTKPEIIWGVYLFPDLAKKCVKGTPAKHINLTTTAFCCRSQSDSFWKPWSCMLNATAHHITSIKSYCHFHVFTLETLFPLTQISAHMNAAVWSAELQDAARGFGMECLPVGLPYLQHEVPNRLTTRETLSCNSPSPRTWCKDEICTTVPTSPYTTAMLNPSYISIGLDYTGFSFTRLWAPFI